MPPRSKRIELPTDEEDWLSLADQSLHNVNVHKLEKLDPASKMKYPQFFALRVLWQDDHGPQGIYKVIAKTLVDGIQREQQKNDDKWRNYLSAVESSISRGQLYGRMSQLDSMGMFGWVHFTQDCVVTQTLDNGLEIEDTTPKIEKNTDSIPRQAPQANDPILNSPTIQSGHLQSLITGVSSMNIGESSTPVPRTPQSTSNFQVQEEDQGLSPIVGLEFKHPATPGRQRGKRDEAIVERSLHAFLQTLTQRYVKPCEGGETPEWTQEHLRLHCGSWVAITDGFLRSADNRPQALVEVKPISRDSAKARIRMQESGQMAAWICDKPNEGWFTRKKGLET